MNKLKVFHTVLTPLTDGEEKIYIDFIAKSVEDIIKYMKVAWKNHQIDSIFPSIFDILDIVDGHIEINEEYPEGYDEKTE